MISLAAESGSYEYGLALPAWHSALTPQTQAESSSTQDSAGGSSQPRKKGEPAAAESLWGAAAEKAVVHGIVLKHLLCQDSDPGFGDRGGPDADASRPSTSQASASSVVSDDSEQGALFYPPVNTDSLNPACYTAPCMELSTSISSLKQQVLPQ